MTETIVKVVIPELPSTIEHSYGEYNYEGRSPQSHDSEIIVQHPPAKGLIVATPEMAASYFEELKGSPDDMRVSQVEGLGSYGLACGDAGCSYCLTHHSSPVARCNECEKSMCGLCYFERDAESAKGTKKYALRKEALDRCFKHEEEGKMSIIPDARRHAYCDSCGETIGLAAVSYDPTSDTDICTRCAPDFDFSTFKKRIDFPDCSDSESGSDVNDGFGSLGEWYPIYVGGRSEDDEFEQDGTYVLQNVRTDSVLHGEIAVVTYDNHGRSGFYRIKGKFDKFAELCAQTEDAMAQVSAQTDRGYNEVVNAMAAYILDRPVYLG